MKKNPVVFLNRRFRSLATLMGAVAPTRINMLHPALNDGTDTTLKPRGVSIDLPANFVSQWIPGGSSSVPNNFVTLGATAIAPDGTSTARKIVEASTTQTHHLVSGFISYQTLNNTYFKFRLSVIVAAAERTRIALEMSDTTFTSNNGSGSAITFTGPNGVRAIFDLAGGTVAVANTLLGAFWVPLPATITLVGTFAGRTYYRCTIDAVTGGWTQTGNGAPNQNPILGKLYLDAGSGSAAANISYAGNGTSGVYAWRSNCLPSAAWNLAGQAFFDDFLSASTFDVSNTKAAGFKWYVDNVHMFGSAGGIMQYGTDFDVANSKLNLHVQDADQTILTTAVSDGTDYGYTGQTFVPPWLMEANWSADAQPESDGFSWPVFWTLAVEGLFRNFSGTTDFAYQELDISEFSVPVPPNPPNPPLGVLHAWARGVDESTIHSDSGIWNSYPRNILPDFTQYHTNSLLLLPSATGTPPSSGSRNILPNSSFAGAVAGTPGTPPTNSTITGNALAAGISVDIVSLVAGKLQFRIHGTAVGVNRTLFFNLNALPAFSSGNGTLAAGQMWSGSMYIRVAAGGPPQSNWKQYFIVDENVVIAENVVAISPDTTLPLSRYSVSFGTQATTPNGLIFQMAWELIDAQAVDITYEIYQPQLELSAMPTPFQASFGGDPTPVLGVSLVDAEPFWQKGYAFFDGNHCGDFSNSTVTNLGLRGFKQTATVGDTQHFVPMPGGSNHVWPSHYDWIAIYK